MLAFRKTPGEPGWMAPFTCARSSSTRLEDLVVVLLFLEPFVACI